MELTQANNVKLNFPNERIFENYGTLQDANSDISKSPYLLIRHGISQYNTFAAEQRQKLLQEYPGDSEENMNKRTEIERDEFGDWRKNNYIVDCLLQEPQGHDQSLSQQNLLNTFQFVKVLVSPHRRTIQTAINILKTHPQLEQGGFTFILFPMTKEVLNNANDLGLSRVELDKFLNEVELANPKIKFDTSFLDEVVNKCPYTDQDLSQDPIFSDPRILGNRDLWYIHIQSSIPLKKELFEKIVKKFDEAGNTEIDHVYDVIMDKYKSGQGVEGNLGIYTRIQRLKELMKEFHDKSLTEDERNMIKQNTNSKILMVNHSRVLQSFSATGVHVDPGTNDIQSTMGKGDLIGSRYFQNCEVFPYQI